MWVRDGEGDELHCGHVGLLVGDLGALFYVIQSLFLYFPRFVHYHLPVGLGDFVEMVLEFHT